MASADRARDQPISRVEWLPIAALTPNDYNPNVQPPPEARLLAISLLEDGWTSPVVVFDDGSGVLIIVDGEHRWRTARDNADVAAMTAGLVPIVRIVKSRANLMMSTIRHNRARGEHTVKQMADIVRELLTAGEATEDICFLMQMEVEEVERLADSAGMPDAGCARHGCILERMGTGMKFTAWRLLDGPQPFATIIEQSPVGPIHLIGWRGQLRLPKGGSAVVLPTEPASVTWPRVDFCLGVGCYAQVPGGAWIDGGAGLVIWTPAYIGLPQAGGPVETEGRLHYIDGCSDSLLVCPAQVGEPCLNLLHLPAGIHQTAHTHPSDRIGIILRGAGVCRTLEGDTPLEPGMCWYIPPAYVHSFHTETDSLDVLAWHPDSDFGPSHDWHPMLNRTIVEGVPASDPRHRGIRTT